MADFPSRAPLTRAQFEQDLDGFISELNSLITDLDNAFKQLNEELADIETRLDNLENP